MNSKATSKLRSEIEKQRRLFCKRLALRNGNDNTGRKHISGRACSTTLLFLFTLVTFLLEVPEKVSAKATLDSVLVDMDGTASSSPDGVVPEVPSKSQTAPETDEVNQCTLYYAPSSIPNAGYGVFTARALEKGDIILANDGPNYAVTDSDFWDGPHLELLGNYWWGPNGGMSDHMRYEADEVYDFQIMFGALPNFHPILSNLDHTQPPVVYDDSIADRTTDPGAGAFSYYTGKRFLAERPIEAGGEIFLNYGDRWLDSHGRNGEFEGIPRSRDYWMAGNVLAQFQKILRAVRDNTSSPQSTTQTTAENSADLMDEDQLEAFRPRVDFMLNSVRKTLFALQANRVLSLVPKNFQQLVRVVHDAEDFDHKSLAFAIARQLTLRPTNLTWVRENGFCLDNLTPGPSTIPGAGKGAIAQRALAKDEVIVPVPLLHIVDRSVLSTFPLTITLEKIKEEDGNEEDEETMTGFRYERGSDAEGATGWQLMLNYCFGHSESTLVLCPATNALLLNHCSSNDSQDENNNTLSCSTSCGSGPNAAIRWATSWNERTQVHLNDTLDELKELVVGSVLTMEVVALCDIAEGEEVFIDYGKDWEKAWKDHVAHWEAPAKDSPLRTHYLREHDVRRMFDELTEDGDDEILMYKDLRSRSKVPSTILGSNVFPVCWYDPDFDEDDEDREEDDEDEEEKEKDSDDWRDLSDDEIFELYAIDGVDFVADETESLEYWPCAIIEKQFKENPTEEGSYYTVRIFQSEFHRRAPWERKGKPCFLYNFPASSIRFFSMPLSTDQHLPGAFRHHIGIPDELFPEHWKNVKEKELGEDDGR